MRIETTLHTDRKQKVTVGVDDVDKDLVRMNCDEVNYNIASFLVYLSKDEALQLASLLTHYAKQK